jgi:putative tricarboxylic transport membrane protein
MAPVPTLKDQGIDAVFTTWRNILGPKNMSPAQLAYWQDAVATVMKSDEWRKDLERNFWTDNFLTGERARRYLAQQSTLYRKIFQEVGLAKSTP